MNNKIVKILEALSKAADLDLAFTDENPDTENNFPEVKQVGKKDMPKEKFDKAGGMGVPKKMNTDPKIDKVSDAGIQGGAKQRDSKSLKKEAYLINMIQEMTGGKVTLKENSGTPVSRETLKKRKDFHDKMDAKMIANYEQKMNDYEAQRKAGQVDPSDSDRVNQMVSYMALKTNKLRAQPESKEEDFLEPGEYVEEGQMQQAPELDEASRAERIARGKGTGNLKV